MFKIYNYFVFKFLKRSKANQDVEKPNQDVEKPPVLAKLIKVNADEIEAKSKRNLKLLEFERKMIPLKPIHLYLDRDKDLIDSQRITDDLQVDVNEKDIDIFFETTFKEYKKFFVNSFIPNGNHFQIKFDDDELFWKIFWDKQESYFRKLFTERFDIFNLFNSSFEIKKTETGSNLGIKPCLGINSCKSRKGKLKYLFVTNTEFYKGSKYKVYKCEYSRFGYHLTKPREH